MRSGIRRKWRTLPALLACMACLISACLFESRTLAGGGTDTESGGAKVMGRILMPGGLPGACAALSLRPKTFLKEPPPIGTSPGDWDAKADAEGFFAFDSVPPGEYLIEADCAGGSLALLEATVAKETRSLQLEPVSLREPGAIKGRIKLEDGSIGTHLVQVYGLERAILVDSATGDFLLDGMPPGVFTLKLSSQVPFQTPADLVGIRVAARETVSVGEIVLKPRVKQAFEISEGALLLPGVGSGNPIIHDNDRFDNTLDDEYLWAKASMGQADLRGNILTGHPSGNPDSFQVMHRASFRELESARSAGMRNIPDILPGAGKHLDLPASGNLDSMAPIPSAGSALIADEARQADADRPLLVFAGGSLTTVASAVLMDPGIAERMVVFGTFNFNRPDEDSLAVYLVAKKCRFVQWGRGFTWDSTLTKLTANPLPSSRYGEGVWKRYSQAGSPFPFFGDFSGVGYLFDRKVFRHARAASTTAPPFQVSLPAGPLFDFVDIPREATDFPLLQEVLFRVLSDSAAYHPWHVPGRIEAEAWSGGSGVYATGPDSVQAETVTWLDAIGLAEYRIEADKAGPYSLELRARGAAPGHILVTGTDGRALARLDLPGGGGWSLVNSPISLPANAATLRVRSGSGIWEVDWLRILPE